MYLATSALDIYVNPQGNGLRLRRLLAEAELRNCSGNSPSIEIRRRRCDKRMTGAAIRFLNRGNHNISFDRRNDLGVASPLLSHIGSVRLSFFNVENKGAVHPGAECAFFWGILTLNGGWSAEISFKAPIGGDWRWRAALKID